MDTVRDRVRFVLKKTGWSQRELARRAELPAESHVSLILTRLGENVRPETLRAIARAAQVSEAWLLTGRGSPDDADAPELAAPAPPTRHPQIRDTPNIAANIAKAKRLKPEWPDDVWQELLDGYPRGPIDEEVLPGMLVALVELDMMFRPSTKARVETSPHPKATGTKGK